MLSALRIQNCDKLEETDTFTRDLLRERFYLLSKAALSAEPRLQRLILVTLVPITEVPEAPKQPTVKEVYHDSALISWEPPADGGKPISGYIVERKETMANRYTTYALHTVCSSLGDVM